jgi:protein-disulfide isomerase
MATPFSLIALTVPVSDRDHILGPETAPVTLLEYGDYECPDCGKAFFVVKELRQLAGDVLRFTFRNFPLMQKHRHAERAAEAAEAAGAQGRFWEMHDTLFGRRQALGDAHLIEYAALLKLDTERFRSELAGHTYAARVGEDIASGIRSGVQATPTFFLNDIRYPGAHDVESLLAAVEHAAEV